MSGRPSTITPIVNGFSTITKYSIFGILTVNNQISTVVYSLYHKISGTDNALYNSDEHDENSSK
ncbi:hypothetical protein G9P44_000600 [Scheffersomyces stipitis]|nr:hypothetical protein G9P44_000600 [Scheffersomyces stipitis]